MLRNNTSCCWWGLGAWDDFSGLDRVDMRWEAELQVVERQAEADQELEAAEPFGSQTELKVWVLRILRRRRISNHRRGAANRRSEDGAFPLRPATHVLFSPFDVPVLPAHPSTVPNCQNRGTSPTQPMNMPPSSPSKPTQPVPNCSFGGVDKPARPVDAQA